MSYKLIEVIKTSEKETPALYDREDLETAYADMRNDFGVAVKQDTTLSVYCLVINNDTGEKMDRLYWGKSVQDVDISIKDRVYTHNDYQEDNVSAYDSEQLAIGNFNTKFAAMLKKADCNFAICIRLDGTGEIKDFAKKG